MSIDQRATSDNGDGNWEPEAEVEPKRKRGGCLPWIIVLLVLLGGGAITGYLMGTIITREETPLPGEAFITDLGLRLVAVPGEFVDMKIPSNADAVKGKDLFLTECAYCHGQDARGGGSIGKNMYPPPLDLTQDRTQTKTDGQLFWLIAHGINLTGMPAFGQKYSADNTDADIWSMVKYIKELRANTAVK